MELEFKLPNPNSSNIEERYTLTEKLYQDITANPEKMEELTNGRASENIFFSTHQEVSLTSLPPIYQENLQLLENLAIAEISPIMEGIYGGATAYDEYNEAYIEELNGFTFFRILNKETGNRTTTTIQDIVEVATQLNLPFNDVLDIQPTDQGLAPDTYQITNGTLLFNNGELYANQEAFDAKILALYPESALGFDEEELANQEEETNKRIEEIKAELATNIDAEFEDTVVLVDSLIGLLEIKQAIPEFDNTNTDTVHSYTTEGITYIILIKDKKAPSDKRFTFLEIQNVDE